MSAPSPAHNPSPTLSRHALFGGGLSAELPSNLIDASDLRQIPDTQEVWLSPDSDVTFIVEILEAVPGSDGQSSLDFHFDSLAHDNDALSSAVESRVVPGAEVAPPAPSPPNQPVAWTLKGRQSVRKFNKTEEDSVAILMAVWRIAGKNTDVVLTVNCPTPALEAFAGAMFDRAVAGFRVEDWGLFAG